MDCAIWVLTGVGNSLIDRPSRRWTSPSRYCPYFWKMFPVPRPSRLARILASPGGTVPDCDIRPISASTGLPGMSCGRKKLIVSAAQAATR